MVGGGKAAAAMAKAVEDHWPIGAPLSGLVVTRYQHGLPTQQIEVVEASHPLPDNQGAMAASRMLDAIRELGTDDLLLVLLSGGGSSLLALPADGVSLEDLRSVTRSLLACGAPIQDINTVRKHLTRFSGGQLASLTSAPIVALLISDVVGDDPASIASGPCAPDPGTFADATDVLKRYAITPPASVATHLRRGQETLIPDTPKPGNAIFKRIDNRVIGRANQSLAAAASYLGGQGIHVINLGELEGEASLIAQAHAAILQATANKIPRPFALLSGGELTVTINQTGGHGGRNTEYLLALGHAANGLENVWAIACDTDGLDGTDDNAGAIWTPSTEAQALERGLDAKAYLQRHDAYGFFLALGNLALDHLVLTGPTRTNVNDFRLVLAL